MFENADDHEILSKFVSNQIFGQKSSWLRLKIYDLHLSLKYFSYIPGGFQFKKKDVYRKIQRIRPYFQNIDT